MSLVQIDAVVSARLGTTRGRSKVQEIVFNRQVAMYLASRVGRWSTTVIGRFYNGRDHSTVSYAVQKIEVLRKSDPGVEQIVSDLERELHARRLSAQAEEMEVGPIRWPLREAELDLIAKLVADQVGTVLTQRLNDLLTSKLKNGKGSDVRTDASQQ